MVTSNAAFGCAVKISMLRLIIGSGMLRLRLVGVGCIQVYSDCTKNILQMFSFGSNEALGKV